MTVTRIPPAAPPTTDLALRRRLRILGTFSGPSRVLHLTWFAFFATFVVWFNLAPFATTIGREFDLTKGQLAVLGLCNVALTVPARIFVGMALDRFGPRRTYGAILLYAAIPCVMFATAQSYGMLVGSRLALSIVGAGFVVGIRMVSEWFPPKDLGTAEGIYGGWGNFGAAAAALTLPTIANLVGGADGWRWTIGGTGVAAALYGVVYLRNVTDTPEGVSYAKPRRQGALEVTNRAAVFGLAVMTVPMWAALVLLAWKVEGAGVIGRSGMLVAIAATAAVCASQLVAVFRVNRPALAGDYAPEDRYPFRSVAVLCLAYLVTFGSELAVVTMLPTFFEEGWSVGPALAGLAAASGAFMNIVARPGGGLLSDALGSRRRTLRALLGGLTVGYLVMATLGPAWPLAAAVGVSLVCSLFGQAGNGAVYAIVPLVKKRVSGQTAGMAGAYGNVGGIVFLTILAQLGSTVFFLSIAAVGALATIACRWLVEPDGSFAAELAVDSATAAPIVDLRHPVATEVAVAGVAGA